MSDFERTFDNVALSYDNSRPAYMEELYADIFNYKCINSHCKVLEIGIGTGKATLPVLETKCNLIGIEPGEKLANLAKLRFKEYDNFFLNISTLQDYECPPQAFDFIYSATAFHWIPEEYGYKRVYQLLKSGGAFARFAYHAGSDKGRKTLADEIQMLYQKYYRTTKAPKEYSEEDAKKLADTAAKYGFTNVKYKLYQTTKDFTAEEYIQLLTTYPDHMSLAAQDRKQLFDGIYSAISKSGGIITIYYTMDLELAQKP